MAVIALYKMVFTGFKTGAGLAGFVGHLGHEWVMLANLLGLLLGFALLADHFEKSRVPEVLPHFLPDDWKGGFVLLVMVFVLSSFLDNIAAALIGGTMAHTVFQAQGAHRLPGGHRRRVQRRRLRQRGRRHDDDHDVDRRRQPARRCSMPTSRPASRWSSSAFSPPMQQHAYSPIQSDATPRRARRLGARRHRRR